MKQIVQESSAREVIMSYKVLQGCLSEDDHAQFVKLPTLTTAVSWADLTCLQGTMDAFYTNVQYLMRQPLMSKNYAAVKFEKFGRAMSPVNSFTFQGTKDEIKTQFDSWVAGLKPCDSGGDFVSLEAANRYQAISYAEILVFFRQSLGIILRTQKKLVEGSLRDVLLSTSMLINTMELFKGFYLCGNGSFIANLNFNLFDAAVGDERDSISRGRLSIVNRTIWPPSGTEILPALMRALPAGFLDQLFPGEKFGDKFGFVMRDLSDEELEECSLVSVKTLDFMNLSFRPDPSIIPIISKGVMSKYERIFSYILSLLRVDAELRHYHSLRDQPHKKHSQCFILEAQSFISSLKHYTFLCVIEAGWRELYKFVLNLQLRDSEVSIADFKKRHQGFINEVYDNLYLSSCFEPIMKLIELVFESIIKACRPNLSPRAESSALFDIFRKTVLNLRFALDGKSDMSNLLLRLLKSH